MSLALLRPRHFLLLILPFLGAVLMLNINSRYGLGLAPDSLSYLSMAKHIASGHGVSVFMPNYSVVSKPIAAYAPLYPSCLAALMLLGISVGKAAWLLAGVFFGLNLLVGSVLLYRWTRSVVWGAAAAWVLLLDVSWHGYHSWILSEPLFVLTTNLALLFLCEALRDSRPAFFYLTVFFAALSSLTKYVGIAYVPAVAFCLWRWGQGEAPQKLKRAAWAGVLASAPLFLWFLRNFVLTGTPEMTLGQRLFGSLIHPSAEGTTLARTLQSGAEALWIWFRDGFLFLSGPPVWIFFVLCLGLAAAAVLKPLPADDACSTRRCLFFIPIIFAASYTAVLAVSLWKSCFSVAIPERYLVTVFTHLLFFFLYMVWAALRRARQNRRKWVGVTGIALIVLCGLLWSNLAYSRFSDWASSIEEKGADATKGVRRIHAHFSFVWFPESSNPPA